MLSRHRVKDCDEMLRRMFGRSERGKSNGASVNALAAAHICSRVSLACLSVMVISLSLSLFFSLCLSLSLLIALSYSPVCGRSKIVSFGFSLKLRDSPPTLKGYLRETLWQKSLSNLFGAFFVCFQCQTSSHT